MKIIIAFLLIISCLLISCVSTKKVMDSWIGSTKQNLVLQLGPPTRNVSDENGGDIFIYERQYMIYNVVRYDHKMFYINSNGKVYSWRRESGPIPAQQMNVNLYVR